MTWIAIFRHFLTFLQISFIFAITVLTYNHFMMSHESPHRTTHFSKNLVFNKSQCNSWESHKKWKSLNFTIKKTTKLFLSLEDFFWKQPMSQLHLPYGPRGSGWRPVLGRTLPLPNIRWIGSTNLKTIIGIQHVNTTYIETLGFQLLREETQKLMILKVLAATASYEMPAHIENLECKTCVVVGNSFAIKNTSLGNLINKYDVVMRLNDAPVRGYEQDVGNKTTMRIFYPESATSNPALNNEEDTLMVLVPFKPNDLRWLKEILYDEKRDRRGFWRPPPLTWEVNSSNVRVLDPFFMYETGNQLVKNQKSFRPTTGFLAVFVALNYCDVVHLAGFGYPSMSNPQQLIHYFGQNTMNHMKSSPHDIDREGKVLKKLEDLGALMYLHSHL